METENNTPFLSIITVAYNALPTLRQTVESVSNQSNRNFEHIIVDGNSTDGTKDYLATFNQPSTRWISEPDTGIYNAMNKGLAMARGEVVSFLNADDIYLPETVSLVLRAFSPEVDVVYGNLRKERLLAKKWYHRYEKPNLDLMPRTMGIFHPATFMRKARFDELGGYNENYRFSADYDWLLRAYLAKCQFRYLDKTLAIFRVGGVSTLNCQSYKEGAAILQTHQTGHAKEMEKLVELCRKNVRKRRLIYTLARLSGTTGLLEKRMAKKWTSNHGGFGT